MKGRRSRPILLTFARLCCSDSRGVPYDRAGLAPFFYPSIEPKWDDSMEDGLPYLQTSGANSRSGGKRAHHILPGLGQVSRNVF
jgi:hypothetical protein